MKISKRLLAVVLSLLMMVSMISCYSFAVGVVKQDSRVVGADPRADHIALVDLAAEDVYVVDAEMTEEEGDLYTLVWDDIPGEQPRTESYYAGVNVFKTVDDAIMAANGDGYNYPTLLIKSMGEPINGITDGYFNIKYPAKYYTQAYRTMPYVVGENPEDAWIKNDDYESRAMKILFMDFWGIQGDCDIEVAGFEIVDVPDNQASDYSSAYAGGCINLINRSPDYVQNIRFVNICINTLDYTNPYETTFNFPKNRDAQYPGTIELDNLYVQSATAHNLFRNKEYSRPYQVAPFEKLIIDGLYLNSINIAKTIDLWLDLRGKDASFTLKNANLSNISVETGDFFRIGSYNYDYADAASYYINGSTGATKDTSHILNISNNTFAGTVATNSGAKAPVSVADGMWNEFIFCNNYVNNVDHIQDYQLFGYWNVNERYTMHTDKYPDNATPKATISGNKIIGVSTSKLARTPAPSSVPDLRWEIAISENYYTPGYDQTAEGVSFDMPENNNAQAESYYLDSAMTSLIGSAASALRIDVNVGGKDIDKDADGVYNAFVGKDYADNIPVVITPKYKDASAKVYLASDIGKTPVANANVAAGQTVQYKIEVTDGENTQTCDLNISRLNADWTSLDEAIVTAKATATEGFCSGTVEALAAAIEAAEALDRINAGQDAVDTAEAEIIDAISSLSAHSFTNYVYNDDANCAHGGTKTAECDYGCGETDTVDDPDHPVTDEHNYVPDVTEPTCTDNGYTTYTCSICGDYYIENIVDALGHDYEDEVIPPTCTEKGYTKHTCKRCYDFYVDNETDALDHDWGEWTVTKPATEQEEGEETRVCKNDSSHVETRKIDKLAPKVEFADVAKDAFYAQPVQWAVANNITNGTGANTFSPNNKCTRGQVVTFLWRAAGAPEPTSTTNPFTDVKESDYFYKAVLWAVENGVTSGTSKTTFSPTSQCTRGQVVTFLWRAKGQAEPTNTTHNFTDVQNGAYYYKAMLWAIEKNITNGTSATKFSPNNTCTRGQVVTFLYRAFN